MRKTILASLLLLVTTLCNAHTNNKQLHEVYNKMLYANGLPHYQIIVVKSRKINAWWNGKNVHITSTLLCMVSNKDELALVLGHELSHAKYKNELKADVQGSLYSRRAGYNPGNGVRILLKMKKAVGEPPRNDVHPCWKVRVNAVKRISSVVVF